MNLFSILTPIIGVVLITLVVIFVLKVMYKPAPPNVAMVITGPTKSRTVIGKGAFIIPIIQRVD